MEWAPPELWEDVIRMPGRLCNDASADVAALVSFGENLLSLSISQSGARPDCLFRGRFDIAAPNSQLVNQGWKINAAYALSLELHRTFPKRPNA